MAGIILSSPWGGMKGPWLCLMGTSLLFGLLWPFPLFMHFSTSLMKLVLGLAFSTDKKTSWKCRGVGNGRGVLLRFHLSLCFLAECRFFRVSSDHSDEIGSPEDALCSFSWEETLCSGVRWLVYCPVSLESSVPLATAQRRAEWLKLVVWWLSLEGEWGWVLPEWEWMETDLQGWREGAWTSRLWGGTEEGVIKQ